MKWQTNQIIFPIEKAGIHGIAVSKIRSDLKAKKFRWTLINQFPYINFSIMNSKSCWRPTTIRDGYWRYFYSKIHQRHLPFVSEQRSHHQAPIQSYSYSVYHATRFNTTKNILSYWLHRRIAVELVTVPNHIRNSNNCKARRHLL